jgi:hypothetical protein
VSGDNEDMVGLERRRNLGLDAVFFGAAGGGATGTPAQIV